MIERVTAQKRIQYKKLISYAVQIIIIGLLVLYFYQNRHILGVLKNISWQQIVWVVLLDVTSFSVLSFINYSMIQRLDKSVSLFDCFLLQYVNNLFNKILPTIGGGATFRAIYLKKKYQFPYSQFASTIAGLYVISFCSTSIIGISCLLVIYAQFKVFNWLIFLAFTGILITTFFIILFSPQIPPSEKRIFRVLKSIMEGWEILKKDSKSILLYTCLSIILLFLSALNNLIVYQALGIKTNLIPMVYLSTLGIILAFINLTPDGIGVKEGIFIFSKDLVQIPDGILVLGSLILRGISICTTFAIGAVSYWVLMRQIKKLDKDGTAIIQDQKPI